MEKKFHFRPRPLIVLLGDSITQLAHDTGFGGADLGDDGPGWGSALQVWVDVDGHHEALERSSMGYTRDMLGHP